MRGGRTPRRCRDGFTLIEVLAALAVLATAFLVLLQTDGLNATRAFHARRLVGAVHLASGMMEDLFATGVEGMGSGEGALEDGVYRWERIVSDTRFQGLAEVRLIVRWDEGGREEEYVVLAYLPR